MTKVQNRRKSNKTKEKGGQAVTLKESQENYRLVVENALVGIYQLDKDGYFLFVNRAFAKMVGYKQKELVDRHFTLVLPPFKVERGKEIFKEIITDDKDRKERYAYPRTRESYLHHKKGHELFVQYSFNFPLHKQDGNLSKIALTGMAIDITEAKKTENELMVHTKHLENLKTAIEHEKVQVEAILNSIGDGVIATDTYGRVIMANKTAEKMLGWTSEELFGKSFADMVPLLDGDTEQPLPKELRPINIVLSTSRKFSTLPGGKYFLFMDKNGKKFPVSITAATVRLNKMIIGAIITFRDITKSREVDQAKSEFVSLASHQLRTPLTIIGLYSEMLNTADGKALSDQQKKYIEEITSANQRMVKLVDMILNVSRIDLGVLKIISVPTDFSKIAEDTSKSFLRQIKEKGLKFEKQYNGLPMVNSDPKLVEVILENLISNAVRYTPPGGRITLSIQPRPFDMFIKIADTGYGIPASQQEKIFSKMFRADNILEKVTQGTGLGLYIIKSIIEKMGGKIWFESEENKGTIFYVSLPI